MKYLKLATKFYSIAIHNLRHSEDSSHVNIHCPANNIIIIIISFAVESVTSISNFVIIIKNIPVFSAMLQIVANS